MECSVCGRSMAESAKFCPNCGTTTAERYDAGAAIDLSSKCPSCGEELAEDDVFCATCGTRVYADPPGSRNSEQVASQTAVPPVVGQATHHTPEGPPAQAAPWTNTVPPATSQQPQGFNVDVSTAAEYFSFRKLISPPLIKVFFWMGIALNTVYWIVFMLTTSPFVGGGWTFLIGLLGFVACTVAIRVYFEMLYVVFQIREDVLSIKAEMKPAA